MNTSYYLCQKIQDYILKTGFFLLICHKTIFSRKLPGIVFVYLLCPIILKHLKKILRSDHEIQGFIIVGQIWPELPIFPKMKFLVNSNATFI